MLYGHPRMLPWRVRLRIQTLLWVDSLDWLPAPYLQSTNNFEGLNRLITFKCVDKIWRWKISLWTMDHRLHMITYFFWAAVIIEKCTMRSVKQRPTRCLSLHQNHEYVHNALLSMAVRHPLFFCIVCEHTYTQTKPQTTITNTQQYEVILKSLCSNPLSAFFDCLAFRFSLSDITEIRGPQPVRKLHACDSIHDFSNYATTNVTASNAMEFIVFDESFRIVGFSMIQHELKSQQSNEVDWKN